MMDFYEPVLDKNCTQSNDQYDDSTDNDTSNNNNCPTNFYTYSSDEAAILNNLNSYRLIVAVFEFSAGVLGVPLNLLVVLIALSFLRERWSEEDGRHLRKLSYNHHSCLLSMALADLFFVLCHCPVMFASFGLSIEFNTGWCRYAYLVTHSSTVASSLSLLILNLDKFYCLRDPLRYFSRNNRKYSFLIAGGTTTVPMIVFVWALSVAWALFFVFGPMVDGFDTPRCEVYIDATYIYLIFALIFFVLPIAVSLLVSVYVLTLVTSQDARRRNFERGLTSSMISSKTNSAVLETAIESKENLALLILCGGQKKKNKIDKKQQEQEQFDSPLNGHFSTKNNRTDGRKFSRWKSVFFVFLTSLWSSVTCLPYRSTYVLFQFFPQPWLVRFSLLCFALMVTNATGNAFITIFTQKKYKTRAWQLITGRRNRNRSEEQCTLRYCTHWHSYGNTVPMRCKNNNNYYCRRPSSTSHSIKPPFLRASTL